MSAFSTARHSPTFKQLASMILSIIMSGLMLNHLDSDPTINRVIAALGTFVVMLTVAVRLDGPKLWAPPLMTTAAALLYQYPDGWTTWYERTNHPYIAIALNFIGMIVTPIFALGGAASLYDATDATKPASWLLALWGGFVLALLAVHQTAVHQGNLWLIIGVCCCVLWGIQMLTDWHEPASS